jgi:hypothetical protein
MTMTNDNISEAGNSGMRCTPTAAHNDHDNFKRLHEEACPNHAYPIRHKLKDCGMKRSLMASGSITCSVELDEGLNGSVMTLFSEENVIMMVYGGRPLPRSGRRHVSSLSPKSPTHCGWGHRGPGV